MTFFCCVTRPRSAGQVTLSSADPLDRPVIDPNHLGEPEDLRVAMAGVRLNLEILRGRAFQSLRSHVCGTCEMGKDEVRQSP